MSDTTIKKVSSGHSPVGPHGQKYLVSGRSMAMRLWEEGPSADPKQRSSRPYETVGFVISGVAELDLAGQTIRLEAGDSWLVPKEAAHRYRIMEPFHAVEVTSPPARVHSRDEG